MVKLTLRNDHKSSRNPAPRRAAMETIGTVSALVSPPGGGVIRNDPDEC